MSYVLPADVPRIARAGRPAAAVGGLLFAVAPLAWHLHPVAARDDLGNPFVAAGPALPLVFGLLLLAALSAWRLVDALAGRTAVVATALGAGLATVGTTLEFLLFPLLGVQWPAPAWFLGRLSTVAGLLPFLVGTAAVGVLLWRRGVGGRAGPALALSIPVGVVALATLAVAGLPGWASVLGFTVPVGLAWATVARDALPGAAVLAGAVA